MKKTIIWLVIAACLVLAGSFLFGGVMTMLQWNFAELSTGRMETREYVLTEDFRNFSIDIDTADVIFQPAQNGEKKIVCYQSGKVNYTVEVQDDTLSIQRRDNRKWYERIGFFFDTPKITVYLPQGDYGGLTLRCSTGDVQLPGDFRFETMEITGGTGHVTSAASISGAARIKTSTGGIRLENLSAGSLELTVTTGSIRVSKVTCQGDLCIQVSTGKTSVADSSCKQLLSTGNTGDITLQDVTAAEKAVIERSTGDIKLTRFDAAEIDISTDTGDIRGSLLTEKIFLVKTDTGKTKVPQTTGGGICRITTDTGDIVITLESQ